MSASSPNLADLRIERGPKSDLRGPRRSWIIFAIILLFAAGAGAWWFTRPVALAVRFVSARETSNGGGDRTVLNASGYVTARREATVSSKVTGKVTEVLIEEGLRVKEGDILSRLDDTNVKASLRLAQAQRGAVDAQMEETRVRLMDAERDLDRASTLKKGSVTSQSDLDHAEASVLALRAHLLQQKSELTVAESTVAVWQQQLEDTIIRAPFGGIVTSKNAQPGEMISPMSAGGFTRTGICTIVDMESLEIEIDVNESYINRVGPGQPVEATLDAYPDWKIACKVIAIIPTADRQKSTVKVRVGFVQLDPRILPDMAVKVAFRETATVPAGRDVVIPKQAMRNLDGHDVVFVVQNGRAERRAVKVGSIQGEDAVLKSGLSLGEKIIVDAPTELVDGSRVIEKHL